MPHSPLSEEVREGDVLEKTVDDGLRLEGGGGLLDLGDHFYEEVRVRRMR